MPPRRFAFAALWAAACSSAPPPATAPIPTQPGAAPAPPPAYAPPPIPVPKLEGETRLRVVYPPAGAAIDARDSSFLFGSTGTGDAKLWINGTPVPVAANGAWLAWVKLPRDSVMRFDVVARTPRDSQRLVHEVTRTRWQPPGAALWVDPASFTPRGRNWVRADEPVRLQVRATPGTTARLRLPNGRRLPLVEEAGGDEVPAGVRAFDRDPANLVPGGGTSRYVTTLRNLPLGDDPGPLYVSEDGTSAALRADADTSVPQLELIRGTDTLVVNWPLQLAILDTAVRVVELDDDPKRTGTTDGVTIGRAAPGATYQWFFAAGTRATLDRRQEGDARVRLSAEQSVWVPAADVQPLPPGVWPPLARARSITVTAEPDRASVRIPLGERIPVRVHDDDRVLRLELYATQADIDWTRYAPGDSLVRRIDWTQRAADETEITVHLAASLWGYRLRWEGTDLLLEVRRPPLIDDGRPLKGRRILVDPGHPPAGATGPTGLREAEANLAISRELVRMLEDEGAVVEVTRDADIALDLTPRVERAEQSGADLLVSIHNNALPDGLNPYTNSGTSVFYNHAQSLPLARAVQAALVKELGLRDLGVARGDLAMVRPTWLPAILTEGLFMIVPEQEAALRSLDGQRRYARGVVEGIRRFLADRAP
jgi:N-acetylmuramoyl-L-alanine amidase